MHDSDPAATVGYIANALDHYALAYLHIVEPARVGGEVPGEIAASVAARKSAMIFTRPNGGSISKKLRKPAPNPTPIRPGHDDGLFGARSGLPCPRSSLLKVAGSTT